MDLETGSRAVALAGLEQKALFRETLAGHNLEKLP